ncbi:hypothetical protein [Leuconostoc sp. DB-1]|uniref:hypothetical protein n=1 Tax=Leuconostoc sp. DB-1 TaxID=2724526 RepID=UPI00211DBE9D|nr:hypothetical protein [Leuconostoc sp. DB-1]
MTYKVFGRIHRGYYHIYYLADLNYKHDDDGTEWYHVKTKDFVHYEKLGIAIPKFQNKWEAVATGSVIKNTNKFFSDLPKKQSSLISLVIHQRDKNNMWLILSIMV